MTARTYTRLVAIVGRPNVGKSTLFNRIIRQRKSLVHDEPGVTRDRIFARAAYEGQEFYLCDTGGFEPTSKDNIKMQLVEQAELAIEEAETVIFVVDGREGMHPIDAELVKRLRKADKNFMVAVNKCDLPRDDYFAEDFRKLGVEFIFPISAEHNRGVGELLEQAVSIFKTKPKLDTENPDTVKLAIIGRPNVGKSSLLNRMAGEARSIVDERPGTTRDTVDISLKYFGRDIQILDTAGIRRKSRMVDNLEKFSALRSLTCLEDCDAALLVIDALEGPTEGDARVVGFAFELRKPILIAVNKWDLIENKDSKTVKNYTENLHRALRFITYVPIIFVSAVENQRVSKILPQCLELYDKGRKRISTSEVNRALKEILVAHTPPLTKGRSRRIKFFYATQVGVSPPRFIIFCSDPKDIHFSYKRFVENKFREAFDYAEIPISIIFRERSRSPLESRNITADQLKKKFGKSGSSLKKGGLDNDIRDTIFDDEDYDAYDDKHSSSLEIIYTNEGD